MQQGFIALYRELLDKPIWRKSTPEQKSILITLLLLANYKEEEWEWQGQKFKVQPGQFTTSLDSIVAAAGKGITIQNVRTALVKFQKYGFLTNESTKTGRLITITNWHLYQEEQKKTNKQPNKDLTKTQQRPNKDLTPNNNYNNDNNKKIYTYADHVSMTKEEYEKLVEQFGEDKAKDWIEDLNLWKGSKGKKTKSDYLTILNWDRKERKNSPQTEPTHKPPAEREITEAADYIQFCIKDENPTDVQAFLKDERFDYRPEVKTLALDRLGLNKYIDRGS